MKFFELTENVITVNSMDKPRSKMNDAPQTITLTCIALPNELVFIDCGVYLGVAKKFREEMEKRFNLKTTNLLLTHSHWDHMFAMEAFEDVDIIIASKGITALKRDFKGYMSPKNNELRATQYQEEDPEIANDIMNAKLFLPNIKVKDELKIGPKNHEILYKVIGNHSADSAVIYSQSEKILCAGDNLLQCYPQLMENSYESIELFQNWKNLEVNYLIPGHGHPVTKEFLAKLLDYYNALISYLKNQITNNTSIKSILKNPNKPSYFAAKESNWTPSCRTNVNWLEAEIEGWYKFLKKQKK